MFKLTYLLLFSLILVNIGCGGSGGGTTASTTQKPTDSNKPAGETALEKAKAQAQITFSKDGLAIKDAHQCFAGAITNQKIVGADGKIASGACAVEEKDEANDNLIYESLINTLFPNCEKTLDDSTTLLNSAGKSRYLECLTTSFQGAAQKLPGISAGCYDALILHCFPQT